MQPSSNTSNIGHRLQDNLRKIEAIEQYSGKKHLHFKTLKNNLTQHEHRATIDYPKERSRSRQKEYLQYSTPSRRSESMDMGSNFARGKLGSQLRSGGSKGS